MFTRIVTTAALGVTLVSCAKDRHAPPKISDAQSAQIVKTVNTGEIELANHVLQKSQNQEVKDFAQHMIKDHTMNNQKVDDLATKSKLTPEMNKKSMSLQKSAELSKSMLMKLSGSQLDKAYIADQVTTHQSVLDDLEGNLIPMAKNDELKAHLQMTAKKVQEHLDHAKALQAKLK